MAEDADIANHVLHETKRSAICPANEFTPNKLRKTPTGTRKDNLFNEAEYVSDGDETEDEAGAPKSARKIPAIAVGTAMEEDAPTVFPTKEFTKILNTSKFAETFGSDNILRCENE